MPPVPRYRFEGFELLPRQRQLLKQGQPVKLGGRAFDLLLALVEAPGGVVDKQALLDRVWPRVVVGDANLAVQVHALRTVLGPSAITTVPGRGYQFTLPVSAEGGAYGAALAPPDGSLGEVLLPIPSAPRPAPTPPPNNLPRQASALIGRDADCSTLCALLHAGSLVTVLGSAGVGKTRLAQHVAQALLPQFDGGVWWIDLAALSDAALVAGTVARVLRTEPGPYRDAARAVAATLRTGAALLVFDNAEHVLDGLLPLVATLRAEAPEVALLLTSQTALRAPGEQRMRLKPLSLPADGSLTAARSSGAMALFEARAEALDTTFRLDAARCASVSEICRRLDGIPLAIELAVARLPLLGLEGLREGLNERFRLLTRHGHAVLPRHQTLRAALDWSYGLLDATEQRVLRRLAVFAGGFTLEAAQAVAGDEAMDAWALLETLSALVHKSLVLVEGAAIPRYRLLETTRLYARSHLMAAGEWRRIQERHARCLDQQLRVPRDDARLWRTPPASPELLVAELDNARAAMDWVSTQADDQLAISLAAGSSHVFLAASLNAEYLRRALPLRDRLNLDTPPASAGLFWGRVALACSRNGHAAGLDAALRAAQVYRTLGDAGRLYDALTWAVAIGSRHGSVASVASLVEEARRLERPDWPPALRSSFQWAQYRWLQMQGQTASALRCAQAQGALLAEDGNWRMHVAYGANVADCEIALGQLQQAEARSRQALQALDALGIDDNIVGHVMDALMVALTLQGRDQEAIEIGSRARRLLEREGDELRLLDTLALNATTGRHWSDAACIAGHVDAAMASSGESRWPSAARRRAQLDRLLDAALTPARQQQLMAAGAAMNCESVFALALRADRAVNGNSGCG
jgi:predicted ATPase/DNA-binding winged helix-turn-helix (wHTH) protein